MRKLLLIIPLILSVIFVPLLAPRVQAQDPLACEQDYVIQPGDLLSSIAIDTYFDWDAINIIIEATNARAEVDSSYPTINNAAQLSVGWKLCLPSVAEVERILNPGAATATPTATATPIDTPAAENILYAFGVAFADFATLTPTPTLTPSPTPTETPTPIPTPTPDTPPTATPLPSVGPATVNHRFDYGIQVDPGGDLNSHVGHVQSLGFRWIKVQMPWKEVEPYPGGYQWGRWDNLVDIYHRNGISVLLSIPKSPDWARPGDDDRSVEGPPADVQTYANFVAAVAGRYAGRVQAIEVWNEQNLYYEAGGEGRVNVDDYMALLRSSYWSIKNINPGMIVVSGAMTPTGAPFPWAVDDVLYLRQMYERGLKDVSDAIGAHPSGFANPPDALYQGGDYDPNRGYDDHRSFFFRNTMEEYRRVMVQFGDGNKAIWPTEFGWPVWFYHGDERFIFARDNTPEEQAQFIRRAYEISRAWGWVGPMFLWNLDYAVTSPNTELANFSIVTRNGLTPAYEALRNMPK
ncbi:MAG: hypothetical protein AAF629_20990 [Chloroflexota bacterium]